MSQVNAGLEAPVGSTNGSTPPGGATPAGDDGRFTRIPTDQMPPGVSWHDVVKAYRAHQEMGEFAPLVAEMRKQGYTQQMVVDALNRFSEGQTGQPAGQQFQPPPAAGITRDDLKAAMAELRGQISQEVRGTFSETLQSERDNHERKARLDAGQRAIQDAAVKAVEALGYKVFEKDGKTPNRFGMMLYRQYLNDLYEVQGGQLPQQLQAEPKNAAEKAAQDRFREEFFGCPAPESLQEAAKRMEFVKDFHRTAAIRAARQQEAIPSETLGAGTPGGKTSVDWKDPDQRMEAVMEDVELPGEAED